MGTSNKYGSTGLGLAITRNITDMMKGNIEVQSELGKGSTFTVTIPLGICGKAAGEDRPFDEGRLRALIVDDDVTACEHARRVLRKLGIESEYTLSGEDALSMFTSLNGNVLPFNLVLADWKMPGMDGIELTRRIRKNMGSEDVTIVLTTYNWYEIMEEAILAGVDAFLAKPLFAASVKEELGKVLANKKRSANGGIKTVDLSGCRVILAEDMEINGQIIKQVLGLKNVRADLATDGNGAVSLFEKSVVGTYDAILMDIRMPGLNGLDATKKIRNMDREDAKTVPIIALTANAFDEDVKLSFDAGMNEHLSKPVEPDALFNALKKLIIK